MRRWMLTVSAVSAVLMAGTSALSAQSPRRPHLHVSDRWDECSFQLDPSLTPAAWRQFVKEGGQVIYFRPLRDAAPMGAGNFEIAFMQSVVGIDDNDAAWNDTFVHPDSTHWLFDGSGLPVPGLMVRAGVTDRLDVGAYFTTNPNANYSIAGTQVQYNVLQQARTGVDASVRASAGTLFGPEDVGVVVLGTDVVVSRTFPVYRGLSVAPYVGGSSYVSYAHESSPVVELDDEWVDGNRVMAGVSVRYAMLRMAWEYDTGSVDARTLTIGVGF